MTLRSAAKDCVPPALWRAAGRLTGRSLKFTSVKGGWADAIARSSGYDARAIVERVAGATREVVAGRAAFERDSVLFTRPDWPFQLLAPLLRAAIRHEGRLEVIDFGGALGSTYRQCRPFIPLEQVQWHVIEQASFVEAGNAEFATPELSFRASVAELGPASGPRVLLVSSVLQYLDDPDRHLREWCDIGADTIIIDRSPVDEVADDHVLCIQHVPSHIYQASYPCWILSRQRLLRHFDNGWSLLAEFESSEGVHRVQRSGRFGFKGFALERQR